MTLALGIPRSRSFVPSPSLVGGSTGGPSFSFQVMVVGLLIYLPHQRNPAVDSEPYLRAFVASSLMARSSKATRRQHRAELIQGTSGHCLGGHSVVSHYPYRGPRSRVRCESQNFNFSGDQVTIDARFNSISPFFYRAEITRVRIGLLEVIDGALRAILPFQLSLSTRAHCTGADPLRSHAKLQMTLRAF